MSISLSSSVLKGWPDFMMWLLYWAWSASCPFRHSISIHVVVACGCELGCVIWFRAEREHLFYKASAPSVPEATWRQKRTSKPVSPSSGLRSWEELRREHWQHFEVQSLNVQSQVGFIVQLTVIKNAIYWFHMYSGRFKTKTKCFIQSVHAHRKD